jgi:hypothetical protein
VIIRFELIFINNKCENVQFLAYKFQETKPELTDINLILKEMKNEIKSLKEKVDELC